MFVLGPRIYVEDSSDEDETSKGPEDLLQVKLRLLLKLYFHFFFFYLNLLKKFFVFFSEKERRMREKSSKGGNGSPIGIHVSTLNGCNWTPKKWNHGSRFWMQHGEDGTKIFNGSPELLPQLRFERGNSWKLNNEIIFPNCSQIIIKNFYN